MWYSKILVAYDGSKPSRRALQVARELAEHNPNATLMLVYAVKLYGTTGTDMNVEAPMFDRAREIVGELKAFADTLPNSSTVRMLKGTSPADLILKCVEDEGIDLIVMGSRGQGGVKGYLGSVSYSVVKQTRACVLIAKEEVPTA